ncbi:secreted RxLR effector protein 161-like [Lactuca sativa]|uniref:secreted RxLR effector protein 161-like n=1 Tax=Lactuca sativa TaxID=4236 RepID=UPI0022AEBC1E|nr:secreted RxLR effector protein 161-like [Lactuca sativa]
MAGMGDCNPIKYPMEPRSSLRKDGEGEPVNATDYRKLIGSLRYLTHTRPDLSYSVGVMSRYMEAPKMCHLNALKKILRYVKGTKDFGLVYKTGGDKKIVGFSDSNHGTDLDDRKGTTGTIFFLFGNVVTWSSQKQQTVSLSSCEAEFMVATEAACQALWLRSLIKELTGWKEEAVKLFVDNKSAIALMENPVFHGRSKHIDTKFHFIWGCVERKEIQVKHVSGEEQRADPLTKALPRVKFLEMRDMLGVESIAG